MSESKRVALVTGGSRGIGLGIAEHLLREGYQVAINGMRPENDVSDTLARLRETGPEVIYCQGSIAAAEDREQIVANVRNHFGQLHVLVNNAGITSPGRMDLLEATEQAFDEVVAVNLKGPYFLTQLVANWMIDQCYADSEFTGSIINISSVSADIPSVNRGDYCLSKAALAMATKLWAVRLAEYEIPVFEIRPGVIRSDMTSAVTEKYDRLIAEGLTHLRRWGEPEDVGRAVAMLVRGDLPYATGQVLRIDGGMTIQTF